MNNSFAQETLYLLKFLNGLFVQIKQKLQMEIDCKATEIEQLQSKLNETASLSSADNDPEDNQVCIRYVYMFIYLCLLFFKLINLKSQLISLI